MKRASNNKKEACEFLVCGAGNDDDDDACKGVWFRIGTSYANAVMVLAGWLAGWMNEWVALKS